MTQRKEPTALEWFERGCIAADLDEKFRCYDFAIRLDPSNPNLYNNRGVTRWDKGDVEGALKDYAEAICLMPDFAMAYNNRGNLRAEKVTGRGPCRITPRPSASIRTSPKLTIIGATCA